MSERETINQREDGMSKHTWIWEVTANHSTHEDNHRIATTRLLSSKKKALAEIEGYIKMFSKSGHPGFVMETKNNIITGTFTNDCIRRGKKVPCSTYLVMEKDLVF